MEREIKMSVKLKSLHLIVLSILFTMALTACSESNTSGIQNSEGIFYKSKLGFSLTFPESWKGKYAIEEQGKKLTVIQKHNNKTAIIFEIWTEAESKWKDLTPKEEADRPVTKICINNGLAFVYYIHDTQPPYMNADDEEKKATVEFNDMLKDMKQIIGSFKII